jgi:hypothetical protein
MSPAEVVTETTALSVGAAPFSKLSTGLSRRPKSCEDAAKGALPPPRGPCKAMSPSVAAALAAAA